MIIEVAPCVCEILVEISRNLKGKMREIRNRRRRDLAGRRIGIHKLTATH